nr:TadE family type IV pilus minor pilin [Bifidobacterium sp. DSM 109963]
MAAVPSRCKRRFRQVVRKALSCDVGAVTAEFATVLPAVVAVAVLLLCLTRTVAVSISCQDAASAAARAVVAGGGSADPSAAARTVAGQSITVNVSDEAGHVTVVTSCPVVPDPLGVLPTKVEGKAVGVVS